MTELERYRKALAVARETMRVMAKAATRDQAEDVSFQADGAINLILNPPPVVVTLDVIAYKCTACGAYYDEMEIAGDDHATMRCGNCENSGHIAKLQGTLTREVQKAETYSLELSKIEAETLLRIGQRVGGSPHNTRRKHVDAINRRLRAMGIKDPGEEIIMPGSGITFKEEAGLQ